MCCCCALQDRTGAVVRRGDVSASPAVLLERYIESAFLSVGERDQAGDHAFKPFDAAPKPDNSVVSLSAAPLAAGPQRAWRLQCYRSKGVLADGAHLRLYFCQEPKFPSHPTGHRLEDVADERCLSSTPADLLDTYRRILDELASPSRLAPSIVVSRVRDVRGGEDLDLGGSEGEEVDGVLLVIGHKIGTTHSYFTGTPDVYRWYGMYAVEKGVEVFANGVIIYTFRLRLLDFSRAVGATPLISGFGMSGSGVSVPSFALGHHHASVSQLPTNVPVEPAFKDRRTIYTSGSSDAPTVEERIHDLKRDVALHFVLPKTSITPLLSSGVISAQEAAYSYCAWKFVYHFITRMSTELNTLVSILKSASTALGGKHADAMSLVSKLRKNVQSHSFTESQILDVIFSYPDIIAWLYSQFALLHRPSTEPER
jgi:glutamate dehydrogenase